MKPLPQILSDTIAGSSAVLLVLSKIRPHVEEEFDKVSVRPIALAAGNAYQFTFHFPNKVTHENLSPPEAAVRADRLLARVFEHAALFTADADYSIRRKPDGSWKVKKTAPTKSAVVTEHNREKEYLIPDGVPCPFLVEIGVMTREGRVRRAMYHKFRQINRFLELVNDVVPSLPEDREIHVIDFGCGKSYLTFALHHLLTSIHGRPVRITGLDRKSDVIAHCSEIARRLECRGLEFREGDIAGHNAHGEIDLAVSLHACDTATDDALAKAVTWNCRVILAVPCCQHELAPKIQNDSLVPLTRHGLLLDRFAALATDSLRALALEICGYTTQAVEFIDMEHTAKNILLRAVRRERTDDSLRSERLREYAEFKRTLGVESLYLESVLRL